MLGLIFAATLSLTEILKLPELKHAIVAGEVYDLDTKRVLWSKNGATRVVGASTTKLLTNGTTLALLGPDFRFITPVYRAGTVDANGTLNGALVLVASGDPNLSQRIQPDGTLAFENEDHAYDGSFETKAVPGDPLAVLRDLARQVAAAGIKRVNGPVLVDSSRLPDQGPEGGTGTVVSSIVVNDNLVDVVVSPGARPGDPVTIAVSPQTPYVNFVVRATTGEPKSEPTIDLSKDVRNPDGSHTVTITGTQPPEAPILYAYRVPQPEVFAEYAFAQALRDAGVGVEPQPRGYVSAIVAFDKENLVAKHVSPPVSEDVKVTMKVSDNLHASLQPYDWGIYAAHAASDWLNAGFAQQRALLTHAGLDLTGASEMDGAGSASFFTPDFMVHYLAWASAQAWYPEFERALPILGVDGTLFNIQTTSPAKGHVFAKTGTFGWPNLLGGPDHVMISKALAGYTTTKRGHHVAFAFFIDRIEGPQSVDTSKDTAHDAGELLGAMATATYISL